MDRASIRVSNNLSMSAQKYMIEIPNTCSKLV